MAVIEDKSGHGNNGDSRAQLAVLLEIHLDKLDFRELMRETGDLWVQSAAGTAPGGVDLHDEEAVGVRGEGVEVLGEAVDGFHGVVGVDCGGGGRWLGGVWGEGHASGGGSVGVLGAVGGERGGGAGEGAGEGAEGS